MKKLTSIITGLMITGLFSACSKHEVKTEHACCQKPGTEKSMVSDKKVNNSNSIYQLTGEWTNQFNEKMTLKQLDGKVQLVAMIFTHCGYACPKMVGNMKAIEKQLPDQLKDKVGFVLITFDTERDTPKQLKKYAIQKQLDDNWVLLHGKSNQVRVLSMLLQIQYNQLPNGDFSHSNILTILDEQGAIAKQIEGLDTDTESALETIGQLVSK
jgi:protein SCO1/2